MMSAATSAMIESEAFKLVEQEYTKLQECIEDFADTINGTISEQKENMLLSHKAQVRKLNIEIEQLKLEKNKLEDSISTNERANLLENERDWYKKEALHLDKVLEDTKLENKELKDKLDECEVDRKWMREQIEKV